jgi:hypothetical protein
MSDQSLTKEESLALFGSDKWTAWGKTEALANAKALGVTQRESSGNITQDAINALNDSVANTINSLYEKLNAIGLPSLTDAEIETFLNKAIEQVTPYYETKQAEIEKGIKEGTIQNMEDILTNIRTVESDTQTLLAKYDIETAKDEEELANKLADITATKDEDLATKKYEWENKINDVKSGQITSDTLTSGIGMKKIQDLLSRQNAEQATVARKAGVQETTANTTTKYDLQTISLARQAAERDRINKIGTDEELAATESSALSTLGYDDMSQLPSNAAIALRRAEANTKVYDPTDLTTLAEQKKQAIESRKLTLQNEELAAREAKYNAEKQSILADISKNQAKLQNY